MDSQELSIQPGVYVGCAGWSLRAEHKSLFPENGTHLERYAQIFSAVEVNSSFYRSHRPATWRRWAKSTPEQFRFSVKLSGEITHKRRLQECGRLLSDFASETGNLGSKLGPVLMQLPPSLVFRPETARDFFSLFRGCCSSSLVCEPRHASWFSDSADELLLEFGVSRAAVDPAPHGGKLLESEGNSSLVYFRLHGSPRIYCSEYEDAFLRRIAVSLAARHSDSTDIWCIFDNTADGFAVPNALQLMKWLNSPDVSLRSSRSS